MRRREFITFLGGAAAFSMLPPARAPAQQSHPLVIFFHSGRPDMNTTATGSVRQGLNEGGFVEGQNLTFDFVWAMDDREQLKILAADIVRRGPSIICTGGGAVTVRAAMAATSTIPIVFTSGGDPVQLGLVASLNRPAGNVTGLSYLSTALEGKRLELLHDMLPPTDLFTVLINPTNPAAETQAKDASAVARAIGQKIQILNASNENEFEPAFVKVSQQKPNALVVVADPLYLSRRNQLVALAQRYAVPAVYEFREHAQAGGLMSYGPRLADAYRQVGLYASRILKGAKPADLPVLQPTKFELVINLKTAKTLGLTVPSTMLTRADEVIE
jgi:putative tryptophan/tyrosine transport system substrate-binding protein